MALRIDGNQRSPQVRLRRPLLSTITGGRQRANTEGAGLEADEPQHLDGRGRAGRSRPTCQGGKPGTFSGYGGGSSWFVAQPRVNERNSSTASSAVSKGPAGVKAIGAVLVVGGRIRKPEMDAVSLDGMVWPLQKEYGHDKRGGHHPRSPCNNRPSKPNRQVYPIVKRCQIATGIFSRSHVMLAKDAATK